MKMILCALGIVFAGLVWLPAQAAADPVGYIISYSISDKDVAEGGVVRGGEEIPVKVWMPLEPGDVVFVRNLQGRVTLDLKGVGQREVTGVQKRFAVEKQASRDDSWDILTQIALLFSEDDAEAPTNLVSKGGDLAVPMAVQGANFIVADERPLWVAWNGSRGPYSLTLDIDGNRIAAGTQEASEIEMAIPSKARRRFVLIIADGLGKQARVIFRLRNKAPQMPAELRKEAALHNAEAAVAAGWLAAQGHGEWRFEAARMLRAATRKDATTSGLLAALAAGWRPAR